MSTTSPTFTERDVSEFFDQTTQTYLSFWDSEGVLHTGYFADNADTDYHAAADRTSDRLAAEAGIDAGSTVLDVGCGCGNFLLRLAGQTGCRGEGLDLSIERVRFAQAKLAERGTPGVTFRHGSATTMPYAPGGFSHVVSQDALFLVPDKPRSHAEMHRVLAPGGILAITDFLQPTTEIGDAARRHVYDRVRWSGGYSLDGYTEALTTAGFEVLTARSLDTHIRQTYRVLGETARQRAATTDDPAAREWILGFAASCGEIQAAIDRGEFGWGMFVARKPAAQ
ncbi:class I SAM-dependent methyltransferase [Micromonospora sp. KC207]|uniref:class I SAM-dependent methyltransferase n=1 Tax=Micromonospora sp. KC207 TaxID=2530377 RepID=UPI001042CC13|nr:class I SAM-dependent methyltransferase [Micromonospora sp. KC207]TDC66645.1 class I SAM-dependent methyltransferase [Micromonospora sp. KC207]